MESSSTPPISRGSTVSDEVGESAGEHIFAFTVTKGQFDSARFLFLLLFKAEVEKK